MVTKEEFENRQEQVKEQIHWFALEFGSIFVLDTLKEHILESIEQAKIDAKEDVADGYEKEEDTSTVTRSPTRVRIRFFFMRPAV